MALDVGEHILSPMRKCLDVAANSELSNDDRSLDNLSRRCSLRAASIDDLKERCRETASYRARLCAETCKSMKLAMRQQRSKTYM